jgi:hypothetical protein
MMSMSSMWMWKPFAVKLYKNKQNSTLQLLW